MHVFGELLSDNNHEKVTSGSEVGIEKLEAASSAQRQQSDCKVLMALKTRANILL